MNGINLAVSERADIGQGLVPCFRCFVTHASEGQLGEHLMREHLMGESQARREAHEAATGIARDDDGCCVGCKRAQDAGHTKYCYVAERARRRGHQVDAQRWDGRVLG